MHQEPWALQQETGAVLLGGVIGAVGGAIGTILGTTSATGAMGRKAGAVGDAIGGDVGCRAVGRRDRCSRRHDRSGGRWCDRNLW